MTDQAGARPHEPPVPGPEPSVAAPATATTTQWRAAGRLLPGDPRRIAALDVVGRLGEGGMGTVYLAQHPEHGAVAIKFVHAATAGDETFRARFRREVEAADRIRSPRVAPVLAADPDATTPWLATAFVDGPTLHEAVTRGGPMGGDRLVALAVALADALVAIHRAGVVHRDLKPSNILLTAETPVVIDFGIASVRDTPNLTRTGALVGTPGWMAPEQVRGGRTGPRADVFAWALVVAFAASGENPFGEGPSDALAYRIVHQAPDLPDLPAPLDRMVPAALTKDPRGRPRVPELLGALTGGVTLPGATVGATTVAEQTAAVPTLLARGWGPDALGGRAPEAVAVPAGPPGPSFWFGGAEHHDPGSLAAAFQRDWDGAADQLFRRRDPIWIGELETFLHHHGLDGALAAATADARSAPPTAALAGLLPALDPHLEPRIGDVVLTSAGLTDAAHAVVDGRDAARLGDRLADVRDAHVLRLWRALPGMSGAAGIDEAWHASSGRLARLVETVAPQVGWPAPEDWRRATAMLLLGALGPDHERRLARQVASARRTSAERQGWWSRLAADPTPAGRALCLLTAARARTMADHERDVARRADRQRKDAERVQRDRARAAADAERARYGPGPPAAGRHQPRAHGAARRLWVLIVLLVGFLVHLWALDALGDDVALFLGTATEPGWDSSRDLYRYLDGTATAVVLVGGLATVAHVVGRAVDRRGVTVPVAWCYVVATALLDVALAWACAVAASMALLVLAVVGRANLPEGRPAPFGDVVWWPVAPNLLLYLVALVLAVRSLWRVPRALFGRPVR